MYNWSIDTSSLKKKPNKYKIFQLEQKINFGLNNKKISLSSLRKHWGELDIDSNKKSYLKKIVWPQS